MTDIRTRTLRILLAGALGLGIVGGAANAAHALTPPAPQQIDAIANPTDPGDPPRPQGPGDFTNGENHDDCPPMLGSCDLAPNPGAGDGGTDGGSPEVDGSVLATPTFTG